MTAPSPTIGRPPCVLTVGAGASPLVRALLEAGYQVIAVDISAAALDVLVDGLGDVAREHARDRLEVVVADVRHLHVDESVDVWHDRAVFHFLVDEADRADYVNAAAAAVWPGGHLVIATFAPSGPESCSGLPVKRHDAVSLQREFAGRFEMVESFEFDHVSPWGASQRFTHALMRRTGMS